MADLKDLQNMAKDGEFSEKLLSDENFKAEFKKIIKDECGVEIKDEDIPEAVKNIEKSLKENAVLENSKDGKAALGEEAMESISGGISRDSVIRGATTVAGAIAAGALANVGLTEFVDYQTEKRDAVIRKQADDIYDVFSGEALVGRKLNNMRRGKLEKKAVNLVATPVAAAGGAALGYKLGDLIVDTLNSKKNSKK